MRAIQPRLAALRLRRRSVHHRVAHTLYSSYAWMSVERAWLGRRCTYAPELRCPTRAGKTLVDQTLGGIVTDAPNRTVARMGLPRRARVPAAADRPRSPRAFDGRHGGHRRHQRSSRRRHATTRLVGTTAVRRGRGLLRPYVLPNWVRNWQVGAQGPFSGLPLSARLGRRTTMLVRGTERDTERDTEIEQQTRQIRGRNR
jgi:hypothetical protein